MCVCVSVVLCVRFVVVCVCVCVCAMERVLCEVAAEVLFLACESSELEREQQWSLWTGRLGGRCVLLSKCCSLKWARDSGRRDCSTGRARERDGRRRHALHGARARRDCLQAARHRMARPRDCYIRRTTHQFRHANHCHCARRFSCGWSRQRSPRNGATRACLFGQMLARAYCSLAAQYCALNSSFASHARPILVVIRHPLTLV